MVGRNQVPCDDPQIEIERLKPLGAAVLERSPNENFVVMHDPEGNALCILM